VETVIYAKKMNDWEELSREAAAIGIVDYLESPIRRRPGSKHKTYENEENGTKD